MPITHTEYVPSADEKPSKLFESKYARSALHPFTVQRAMEVPAHGVPTARSIIDGVIVIWNPEQPYSVPPWLRLVLEARDDDGNTPGGQWDPGNESL